MDDKNPYPTSDLRWHCFEQVQQKHRLVTAFSADVSNYTTKLNNAIAEYEKVKAQFDKIKSIE